MANEAVTKKLSMSMVTDVDTTLTLIVANPLDTLDSEIVLAAMTEMVSKEILTDSKGNLLTGSKGAKIITTSEEVLF